MAVVPAFDSDAKLPAHGFRYSLRTLLLVVFACGVLFAFMFRVLLPAVTAARDAEYRSQCTNNLKQIGGGLHNYADVYDSFPPAFAVDEAGAPKHSWRALLAPFEWQYGMHSPVYDFQQPWDCPNNVRFANFFPGPYICPQNAGPEGIPRTDYVMVVGPRNFSAGATGIRAADIRDGAANMVAVVEIADSDIMWIEPRDVPFNAISFKVNDRSQRSISSHHVQGANVLMADGHVRYLGNSADRAVVEALLTVSAGDDAPTED